MDKLNTKDLYREYGIDPEDKPHKQSCIFSVVSVFIEDQLAASGYCEDIRETMDFNKVCSETIHEALSGILQACYSTDDFKVSFSGGMFSNFFEDMVLGLSSEDLDLEILRENRFKDAPPWKPKDIRLHGKDNKLYQAAALFKEEDFSVYCFFDLNHKLYERELENFERKVENSKTEFVKKLSDHYKIPSYVVEDAMKEKGLSAFYFERDIKEVNNTVSFAAKYFKE